MPGALIDQKSPEREIYKGQVKKRVSLQAVMTKIVDGKLEKFYSTVCLLEQGFIKNPDQTIKELVSSKIAELGKTLLFGASPVISLAKRWRTTRLPRPRAKLQPRSQALHPPERMPAESNSPWGASLLALLVPG